MHDRLIPLEHVANFRDFGGYEAAGGARVRRGALYRSASFQAASEADIAKLDQLGVAVCVDLRRTEERAAEPNRWPGGACRTIVRDEGYGGALPPHLMALLQADVTAQSVRRFMLDLYAAMPFDSRLIALYRDWFAALAEGKGAQVIHCAAGKDRTGLGCALTLFALGVPEDAVFADYEFTNEAVAIEARLPRIKARMEARLGKPLDADALRPMLGVDADYLRAALAAIEARHGRVEVYLDQALGVDAPARRRLREVLNA